MRFLANAAVVAVFAAVAFVAAAGRGPEGDAYSYAALHVTLHGKIAALSHYDVLKTTEPLTCSDGARNFTCLLMKTDVNPVLNELGKIGVRPTATPTAHRWVLVLEYNFTEDAWRWRNVTVLKSWELRWNNETVYLLQAQIKRSLGEMVRINRELSETFFGRRELKNITAVAVHADKIAVGTSNGTVTNGRGKPDHRTVGRIREHIKRKYGDMVVEVYYTTGAKPLVEMAGDYPVLTDFNSFGQYKYEGGAACTLGYLGYLYGDPNLPAVITAWHCFGFVGTDRTSPYTARISFMTPKCVLCSITAPSDGFLNPGPYYWWEWYIKPMLFVQSDSALIGKANDPSYFERLGLKFGYIRGADGSSDLPIMLQLSKYDVKEGDSLWIRLGRSGVVSKNVVNSLCASFLPLPDFIRSIFDPSVYYIPALSCHTRLSAGTYEPVPGDSGSPVYRLRIGSDYRYAVVDAYGVLSAEEWTKEVYVADISWIYVKVSWLG